MSTSPRYSAPDRSRQRIRLIAAIGLLASTAIAIGGLVGLVSAAAEPSVAPVVKDAARPTEASSNRAVHDPLYPLDSIEALILEVERAERAASSARAALRRARTLGTVDTEQLDWLERRLDALGRYSTAPSPASGESTAEARGPGRMHVPIDEGPREL